METGEKVLVNGKSFEIQKLLGKGKGGYSYLCKSSGCGENGGNSGVPDGNTEIFGNTSTGGKKYTLKQIHHEPCSYYTFGNKIEAEFRDYSRLLEAEINIPKLIEIDFEKEILVKEFIDGPNIVEIIKCGEMKEDYIQQVREMCSKINEKGLNLDYYPTNFLVQDGILYYVDYECSPYSDEWNFENWGKKYWSRTEYFIKAFCGEK